MSEPIPEAIPQSQQAPRSHPPVKRSAPTPTTQQATLLASLFSKPDREIQLPPSSSSTALSKSHALPPPPEIVANVQGSSAGAGSGEFHVYKASRRREYERVKLMEEEVAREEADRDFLTRRDDLRKKDKEKTEKRRRKREKIKGRKGARKDEDGGGGVGSSSTMDVNMEEREGDDKVKEVDEIGVVICDDD